MCEIRQKVELYRVNLTCPICKEGYMFPTGIVLTSIPPLHQHQCNSCGYITNLEAKYPYYDAVIAAVEREGNDGA